MLFERHGLKDVEPRFATQIHSGRHKTNLLLTSTVLSCVQSQNTNRKISVHDEDETHLGPARAI